VKILEKIFRRELLF